MESLDVEVAHVLQVKTKDHHLGLVVPSDLVLEHEEKKYLKLIGSHHWLCKLVCPEAHKKQKNLSLANTSAMKEVCQAVVDGFLSKEQEDDGEELFGKKPDEKKPSRESDPLSEPEESRALRCLMEALLNFSSRTTKSHPRQCCSNRSLSK